HKLRVDKSLDRLLSMIPPIFMNEKLSPSGILPRISSYSSQHLFKLEELVLDEGSRPRASIQGHGSIFLCEDKEILVTREHLEAMTKDLERNRGFGPDNRAGVDGELHRISAMRDKQGKIYGLTIRIGRFFPGSADVIDDLLFYAQDSTKMIEEKTGPQYAPSILVLGPPGSGKTTVIREICRKVSQTQTLIIVDTSNEIAGDGRRPHRESIGQSRRMMVADKANQDKVMIETLQNHTPQTMVIDEISNKREAMACRNIKERGVRVVASAHGDLSSVLNNPELDVLVGGKVTSLLGDELAKKINKGSKVC
ncbi:unnamed protein product, partial [Choristocarpus tenellus]